MISKRPETHVSDRPRTSGWLLQGVCVALILSALSIFCPRRSVRSWFQSVKGAFSCVYTVICCTAALAGAVLLTRFYTDATWPWLNLFLCAGLLGAALYIKSGPVPNFQESEQSPDDEVCSSAGKEVVQASPRVLQQLAAVSQTPQILAVVNPKALCVAPQVRHDAWSVPQARSVDEAFGRTLGKEAARNGPCSTRPASVPEDSLGEGVIKDWNGFSGNYSGSGGEFKFTGLASFPGWSDGDACSITDTQADLSAGQLNSMGSSGFGLTIPFMKSQDFGGAGDSLDAVQNLLDECGGRGSETVAGPVVSFDLTRDQESSTGAESACIADEENISRIVARVGQYRPYVSKIRRYRVVTKIPHLEPEQVSPDFLERLRHTLANHPTSPSLIVGFAIRRGCIELVLDLVSLLSAGSGSADLCPAQLEFLDPATWLHHLHVVPLAGTQVLTQACGRVWQSTWDIAQGTWLISPFPYAPTKLPRLISAPGVLLFTNSHAILNHAATATATSMTVTTMNAATSPFSKLSTAPAFSSTTPELHVVVGISGDLPDVCVRCCGSYVDSSSILLNPIDVVEGSAVAHFTVSLEGSQPTNGLLMLETKLGWMVTDSTPVLMTADAGVAREMEWLLTFSLSQRLYGLGETAFDCCACIPGSGHTAAQRAEHHDFIIDLGSWFDYVSSVSGAGVNETSKPSTRQATVQDGTQKVMQLPTMAARSTAQQPTTTAWSFPQAQTNSIYNAPAMRAHMAKVGVSLVVSAVVNACPHTAALLVQGMVTVGHSPSWVVAQCAEEEEGTTLLQHALATGCPNTVRFVRNLTSFKFGNGCPTFSSFADDCKELFCSPDFTSLSQKAYMLAESCPALGKCREFWDRSLDKDSPSTTVVQLSAPMPVQHSVLELFAVADPQADVRRGMIVGGGQIHASGFHSVQGKETGSCSSISTSLDGGSSSSGDERKHTIHSSNGWAGLQKLGCAGLNTATPQVTARHDPNVASSFPASYRVWLGRQNTVYANHFFTIIFLVIFFVTARQVLEGHPPQGWAFPLFVGFHLLRVVGMQRQPAWFQRHSEVQNVAWLLMRAVCKAAVILLNAQYAGGPPLPYLGQLDWLIEGVLPTLCLPVRPSISFLFCTLDAFISSCLYSRYRTLGGGSAAIAAACTWNAASLVLCVIQDRRNQRTFLAYSSSFQAPLRAQPITQGPPSKVKYQ